jgi:peptidoglycan/LPS O-acetylase OafA/YrhL
MNLYSPNLSVHIPSLSGLRGLSILLVIFAHAVTTQGAPIWLDKPYFASLGNIGVRIFFVISGFLITTLLVREYEKTGKISLKDFYIRRAFRILPAAFVYIGLIWIAYLFDLIDLRFHLASKTTQSSAIPGLLHALSFTYNYVPDYNWYFNHLWSLSVEEQFYLLWPLIVVFCGFKRASAVGLAILLASPIIRFSMLHHFQMPIVSLSREFQAVADALLIGCLASIYFNQIRSRPTLSWFIDHLGWIAAGLLIAAGYLSAYLSRDFAAIIGQSLGNFGACLLLLNVVSNEKSIIARVLRWRVFVWLGLISYSLYLWQQPFLFYFAKTPETSFPVNIILAFGAALLSYHWVEKPALKLRHTLAARREPLQFSRES